MQDLSLAQMEAKEKKKLKKTQEKTQKKIHLKIQKKIEEKIKPFSTGLDGYKAEVKKPVKNLDASKLRIPSPIISLGLLGTRTSTLARYFHCAGYKTAHSSCRDSWEENSYDCGQCLTNNINEGRNPLDGCGNYDVYSQLGFVVGKEKKNINGTLVPFFYLPQVEHLEKIVEEIPTATFILTTRVSSKEWANAILKHFFLRKAFEQADLNLEKKYSGNERKNLFDNLVRFYRQYNNNVKKIVGNKLIIINTDQPIDILQSNHKDTIDFVPSCWKNDVKSHFSSRKSFSISSGGSRRSFFFGMENPKPKLKLPLPVISVGFPKTATTSLFHYFHCGRIPTSHYRCATKSNAKYGRFRCGDCIQHNIKEGNPIFANCGTFDVWAEINASDIFNSFKTIFLPQVEHLDLIHNEYPDATFVLTKRNPDDWVQSVLHWNELHTIFINTNITGLPAGMGETEEELRSFFLGHQERIRQFVTDYPSHTLVEVDIDDPDVHNYLEDAFGIDAKCWSKTNVGSYHGNVQMSSRDR